MHLLEIDLEHLDSSLPPRCLALHLSLPLQLLSIPRPRDVDNLSLCSAEDSRIEVLKDLRLEVESRCSSEGDVSSQLEMEHFVVDL